MRSIFLSVIAAMSVMPVQAAASENSATTFKITAIHDLEAVAQNGGFNPEFAATLVRGKVILGGNACEAQGMQAKLVLRRVGRTPFIQAVVYGRRPQGRICPRHYKPVFADVSITVRDRAEVLGRTVVKNAYAMGVHVSLEDLSQCSEPVVCTREYNPQLCVHDGVTFHGGNPCEAAHKLAIYSCVTQSEPVSADVVCSTVQP